MPLWGDRGEPLWEERTEAVPTPWMAPENPSTRPPRGGDTQCWHASDRLCLCRPISAAWTRTSWQPPSKPLGAVPLTSARCGTPASMVWSSSSPTGMVSTHGGDEIWALLSLREDPPEAESLPTELVVAESVVVIKKLLQMQPAQHSEIIKHMAKLTDNIQVGQGMCVLLWSREGGSNATCLGFFCRCQWRGQASCG